MRLVSNMVTARAGLSVRRTSTSSTQVVFSGRRRQIRRLKDRSRQKSANLLRSESLFRVVTKKSKYLRVKSQSSPISSLHLPLSCRISEVQWLTSTKSSKKKWSASRLPRRSTKPRRHDCLQSNQRRKNLSRQTRALSLNSRNQRA